MLVKLWSWADCCCCCRRLSLYSWFGDSQVRSRSTLWCQQGQAWLPPATLPNFDRQQAPAPLARLEVATRLIDKHLNVPAISNTLLELLGLKTTVQYTKVSRRRKMVLRKDELEVQLKDEHQLIRDGVLKDDSPLDVSNE